MSVNIFLDPTKNKASKVHSAGVFSTIATSYMPQPAAAARANALNTQCVAQKAYLQSGAHQFYL